MNLNDNSTPFTMPSTPHLSGTPAPRELRLTDVSVDEVVEVVRFEMSDDQVEPFLERGVLPGCRLCPVRRSPSGDPIVEVDGVLLALRRETAGCICVRRFELGAD
ncbi:MAG: FeoA family protein [Longimicrobiales bacterium]|nr:FeoA family protein [Longimicrobiales bacterium]